MIALLLALTAAAASPSPQLFTSQIVADRSFSFGNGQKARIFQRGAGAALPAVSVINATGADGFRSFTLTTTGLAVSRTVPIMRCGIAEVVGATGWVDFSISRGTVEWRGRLGAGETLVIIPSTQTSGPAVAAFTPLQPNTILNLWWRN